MEVSCDTSVFQARLQALSFYTYVIFSIKKALLPEKFLFQGREQGIVFNNDFYASCYHPKFTHASRHEPYQLRTRNDSSTACHCNGCTRRSLGRGASVRGSETILGGSLGACFHRSRLSVAYLTAYSSLHSLSFCKHKNSAVWAVCQPFLETPAIFPRRNWQNTTEGRDL